MTCREKLAIEHQNNVNTISPGGCYACPITYGYLSRPDYCHDEDNVDGSRCDECWDREIPGTPLMQYPIDKAAEAELAKGEEAQWTKENPNLSDVAKKAIEEHKARILDSGNRTQFESGAVRDMREGKGRCDLMPLAVACKMLSPICCTDDPDHVTGNIAMFLMRGFDVSYLYCALSYFAEKFYNGSVPTMLLEVAKHFEDGAKKYGENNWQKGIPVHCYIDSAVRHYLKWLRGDKDEPHDRAFVWNLMCCIWEVDYREKSV